MTINLEELAVQSRMAQRAYENKPEILEISIGDWAPIGNSNSFPDLNLSSNGYFGIAYRNEITGEIRIVSRGTEASNIIGFDYFNDIQNDIVLGFKKNPSQIADALAFTKKYL